MNTSVHFKIAQIHNSIPLVQQSAFYFGALSDYFRHYKSDIVLGLMVSSECHHVKEKTILVHIDIVGPASIVRFGIYNSILDTIPPSFVVVYL